MGAVGLERAATASQASPRNPKKKPKQPNSKTSKKRKHAVTTNHETQIGPNDVGSNAPEALPVEPLSFFLDEFQTANDVHVSSLEFESMKDTCILGPPQSSVQDDKTLMKYIKEAFGSSWKEVLCKRELLHGKAEPGSPAVLIISTSALRSIELLKSLRSLTQECHAVKLFSKHMKVEEQVELLKNHVNIASGTPSRIKKLIDIEALGLSRLAVIVLDIKPDVKGYSLFSLPQVRDEFWDLYKSYLHPRVVESKLRICLFGPLQPTRKQRKKEVTSAVK
ncbi:protein CMS1 [Momordica charantia]|uniref:Protein CMS1 n=1 Tax=Momordica charantia TaxID=3673 RepID=A0A6J1C8S6_MOMCH|nr:protein CMS1 [Momordica charantia]